MPAYTLPPPKARFFDANGDPLAGGKLYSYIANTVTPRATYTDSTGDTENANPVILDANGEADVFITSGYYKFILHDANDVLQWTEDNISLPQTAVANVPVGGTARQALVKIDSTDYSAEWRDIIKVTGSRGTPQEITEAVGIAFSGTAFHSVWFVEGNLPIVVMSANPQIAAGSVVGQTLEIIGRNDTDYVTLVDGNGISIGGAMILSANSVIGLTWDGTEWVERYRTSS